MTAIALEANLIQLDTFLKSGDAPLECMTLSDLDGFLTGIAVGPEPIPPREWLPVVWGEEAPTFVNEAQARVVLDAIMGRYNEILREIDEGAPQPILWRASDGATIASDWAKGFAKAMALRLGLWDQLARSKVRILLAPIMLLSFDGAFETKTGLDLSSKEKSQAMEKGAYALPFTIRAMHEYWRTPDSEKSKFAADLKTTVKTGNTLKVGRNDPCPCGSGKKFKKCCGA